MRRAVLAFGFVCVASLASAGTITASSSGCVSSLPTGASWIASEGFVFMAYYSLTAGCDPTLEIPTGGFHAITVSPDSYRVDVLAKLLPTCGRLQFDAHAYSATGLDPFGLTALVYDTGRNCVAPKPLSPLGTLSTQAAGHSGQTSGGSSGGTVTEIPPYTPPYVPPGGGSPVPVPESSSTLLLGLGSVLALGWLMRTQWDKVA